VGGEDLWRHRHFDSDDGDDPRPAPLPPGFHPAAAAEAGAWAWTSADLPVQQNGAPQTLALAPGPVLACGGHLHLALLGRTARQAVDDRFYTCLAHVAVHGRAVRGLTVDAAGRLARLHPAADPLARRPLAALSEGGRPARLAARPPDYGPATDDDGPESGGDDDDDDDGVPPPPPAALMMDANAFAQALLMQALDDAMAAGREQQQQGE
jgi:hypothetical protein